jgi:hypothetical protein
MAHKCRVDTPTGPLWNYEHSFGIDGVCTECHIAAEVKPCQTCCDREECKQHRYRLGNCPNCNGTGLVAKE